MDIENENKNINDLGDNSSKIDDLEDDSKLLSNDISSKIDALSHELNSILFELEYDKKVNDNDSYINIDDVFGTNDKKENDSLGTKEEVIETFEEKEEIINDSFKQETFENINEKENFEVLESTQNLETIKKEIPVEIIDNREGVIKEIDDSAFDSLVHIENTKQEDNHQVDNAVEELEKVENIQETNDSNKEIEDSSIVKEISLDAPIDDFTYSDEDQSGVASIIERAFEEIKELEKLSTTKEKVDESIPVIDENPTDTPINTNEETPAAINNAQRDSLIKEKEADTFNDSKSVLESLNTILDVSKENIKTEDNKTMNKIKEISSIDKKPNVNTIADLKHAAEIKNTEKTVKKYPNSTDTKIKQAPIKSTTSNGSGGDNNRPKKKHRPKGSKAVFVWAIIASICVFLGCIAVGGVVYFTKSMCEGMPEFSAADLDSSDSSIIYDADGNQIIELGLYLRENVDYDSLPNCVVDSFLSIEDSRFFSHFGFDVPRFTKAIIDNLKTMSFGQGGSTMTMQLIKLSYFQIDDGEDSTMAARSGMSGVQRKIQEIILALQAEQKLSKKEIISLYLNKVNFGDNIRGIQKAAEYYFGKDASELSLNESAFLAGIVNAPNGNNPYNAAVYEEPAYLEAANNRKNEVLDLMLMHGYITEDECKLNKAVRIENLVAGKNSKFKETNTYYQSYIDAVINEVQEVTGKNPYTTAMNIYTTMDPYMQEYVYNMQNRPEIFADRYRFRHDDQQNALVVLNNQTGELVALGGGRFQADNARQFNRAVDSYINPGSSVKPVLEYVLAFDRLGYATSHTICDKPVFLYETDIAITNAYGQGYTGDMQITEALARSLNTPAIQLMAEVLDFYDEDPNYEIADDALIEYCQSIGFDYANRNTFDIQWAIGGKDCLVSPVQLAGAHAMLIHDGKYVKPHTIKRIEYRGKYNDIPDYIADTEGERVVSSAAAYMTAYCENFNVNSGWIGQLNLLKRDYPTFAKTGTTTFSEQSYDQFNIPESAAKDQWLCVQTSNYTIVVWNGFDKLAEGSYFTVDDENYNLKCKMGSILLDALMDHYNYDAHALTQPDDCIEIEHILGCFPYARGGGAKGLISKNSPYAELVDEASIQKEVVGGVLYHMGAAETAEGLLIHWDEFNSYGEDGTIDTTITSVSGNTTVFASGRSYYQRYNFVNPGGFYATITAASGETTSVESPTPTTLAPVQGVGPFTVCGWTAANPNPVCGSSRPQKDN